MRCRYLEMERALRDQVVATARGRGEAVSALLRRWLDASARAGLAFGVPVLADPVLLHWRNDHDHHQHAAAMLHAAGGTVRGALTHWAALYVLTPDGVADLTADR